MSTVRLLKDDQRHGKKGDTVTVPFLEARDLVAWGIAERPGAETPAGAPAGPAIPGPGSAAVQPADTDHQRLSEENRGLAAKLKAGEAAAGRAAERVAALEAENKAFADDNRKLADENKRLAAENKKLAEDLAKAKK